MNQIDTNLYGNYPYFIDLFVTPDEHIVRQINKKPITNKTPIQLPPKIDIKKIGLMSDVSYLSKLEIMYDEFVDKNQHILSLYNIIDEILDIRDALTIQVSKLKRKETNKHYTNLYSPKQNTNNENTNELLYQQYLPVQLSLTFEQIKEGYKLVTQNEPKEYKCGCEIIHYINKNNNKNKDKVLKMAMYCIYHGKLKKKEKMLTTELKIIRKEIMAIKNESNSIDFDIEICKTMKIKESMKVQSKYPWKQGCTPARPAF